MKIKTSELNERALDWAVGKIEWTAGSDAGLCEEFCPSTDWAHGGPIIERGEIQLTVDDGQWCARLGGIWSHHYSPLIAAMRCLVASKIGDEVDVPEELVGV
jgi:hypothetical protein